MNIILNIHFQLGPFHYRPGLSGPGLGSKRLRTGQLRTTHGSLNFGLRWSFREKIIQWKISKGGSQEVSTESLIHVFACSNFYIFDWVWTWTISRFSLMPFLSILVLFNQFVSWPTDSRASESDPTFEMHFAFQFFCIMWSRLNGIVTWWNWKKRDEPRFIYSKKNFNAINGRFLRLNVSGHDQCNRLGWCKNRRSYRL